MEQQINNELQILCLGSGSSGNCYLLGKGEEYIMVECGLPFKSIINKLAEMEINIDQIKGLCISHSHKDHSLSINELESLGIPILAPWREENGEKIWKPTDWLKVRPFPVIHDVACYGFVFLTTDNESVLFITDTRYIESNIISDYRYNYIMVECNHIRKQLEAIMDKAILEGNESKVFKFKRQASYHLSLAGVRKMLKGMDLSQTKAIFLTHLSKECCNDDVIKKDIFQMTKIRTLVCLRNGGIN